MRVLDTLPSSFEKSIIISSPLPIPESCLTNPCIAGVDEAGRGPVMGPMIYSIFFYPESQHSFISKQSFADSKQLKAEQREELFKESLKEPLCTQSSWVVKVLIPKDISESMFRKSKYSLNALSHDTVVELVKHVVSKKVDLKHVFVDTVGPPEKYQAFLSMHFPNIQFTVSKKADSLYPSVSGASIMAKVVRDDILKHWECIQGKGRLKDKDFGSGYPSDPKTVEWLKNNLHPLFGFPDIIRFSWSTCTTLMETNGYKTEWSSDEVASKKRKPIFESTANEDPLISFLGIRNI